MSLLLISLCVLLSAVSANPPRNVVTVITVDNGNDVGDWKVQEYCPAGTYAVGFELKVQPDQGNFADDTGMNGMRLRCEPRAPNPDDYYGVIEGYRGEWGDWRQYMECNEDHFLNGFRAQVLRGGLFDDDTGVNNLDFECRKYDLASSTHILTGDGRDDGDWGDWSNSCPISSAICGFTTRYDGPSSLGCSAVNDLQFFCCDD